MADNTHYSAFGALKDFPYYAESIAGALYVYESAIFIAAYFGFNSQLF